ncbi:hypothetical protein NYR88_09780 [Actinobacillus equuli subsp. haemolyticus]|nr:hypothetical protein NYR88_09780 [Actinobacillus equuli subsp. haemolyticus]
MSKTVIGIRTHQWTINEERLYKQLEEYFKSENIYFIVDETKEIIQFPQYINKIPLNKELLTKTKILSNHPNPKGLGRLCGDYFYYAFRRNIQADYYWLIESDVDFTFPNLGNFFQKFEQIEDDALLYNFGPAMDSWAWTQRGQLIAPSVYQAFFPLSRLSGKAIDSCLIERQKLTHHFIENKVDLYQYPNDESLVATAVMKANLKVAKLNDFWKDCFKFFTYRNQIIIPNAKNLIEKNQVLHPSRSPETFANTLNHEIVNLLSTSKSIPDLINRVFVSPVDVEKIINQLKNKALLDIEKLLKTRANYLYFLNFIKRILDTKASEKSDKFAYKSWVYRDSTLVLDVYINSENNIENHVIEYSISQKNIICNIFTRKGNDQFIHEMSEKHDISSNENKLRIFDYLLYSDKLNEEIINSLSLFFHSLEEFYFK